ncbi:MAG: PKD domain-containing protein [Cyclobacteriaceae bacterium]
MNRSAVKPLQTPLTKFNLLIVYLLTLAVITACNDDEQVAELVNGEPVATFEVNADPANPDMVTYTSTSTNAFSYIWNLGDGTTAITREITHTYDSSAVFNVSLQVANRGGESNNTASQEVRIVAAPSANYSFNINDQQVTFSNGTRHGHSFIWDFGDGNTSVERNPTHTYQSNGVYTVTLTTTNTLSNETNAFTQIIAIGPLTADFETTIDGGNVQFTNLSTNAVTYTWDLGDGSTSTEENPLHIYLAQGTYNVTLVASVGDQSESITKEVVISSVSFLSTLASAAGKTWTLAEVAGSVKVGPSPGSGEWWPGPTLDEVTGGRSCLQDDEFTFFLDGRYTYNSQGSTLYDDYIPGNDGSCADPASFPAPFDGLADNDNHSFLIIDATDTEPAKITVNGSGAFIGFAKATNAGEYTQETTELENSITYQVVSFTEVDGKERLEIAVDYCGPSCWWTITLEAND